MNAQIKKSKAFNAVTVFSYIGNAIGALLAMILLIACITNGTSMENSGSFDALAGGLIGVMAVLSALVIVMCYLCLLGVAKMRTGKTRGFLYYLIGNGLWVVFMIYAGREGSLPYLTSALISIGFTVFYAMKLPKMT
jgi:hypothetical protein